MEAQREVTYTGTHGVGRALSRGESQGRGSHLESFILHHSCDLGSHTLGCRPGFLEEVPLCSGKHEHILRRRRRENRGAATEVGGSGPILDIF